MSTSSNGAGSVSREWNRELAAFAAARATSGLAAATVEAQRRRVERFGRAIDLPPWEVTTATLTAWLDQFTGSPNTCKLYRGALRAFYRFGVEYRRIHVSPMPVQAVTRYRLDNRWQDALANFESAQGRAGLAPSTVRTRVKYVTRFATEYGGKPWSATAESIGHWLDGLTVNERSRQVHRGALRAFYGWARRAGHIETDPSEPLSERIQPLPIPEQWQAPLHEFARAARASGALSSTVAQRSKLLGRFARAHASLDPWQVSLDDALDWMGGHRWAAETRRLARTTLRSFYRWAEDTGRIDDSPMRKLPVIKAAQPRARVALERDYRAALAGASRLDALALRLSAELGLRRGEVALTHTSDMYEHAGAVFLRVHGKGDRERLLPVPGGLAAQLLAQPPGYLFPGKLDGHISPRYLGKRVSALLPLGVTMHMLRHRFATQAYSATHDLLTVQQLLGHASPATTQRYVQIGDSQLRAAVESVAAVHA